MDSGRLVYVNGDLVPEAAARISIFDLGLMYGVTLYESLRTFRHRWFLIDEHWRRLQHSLGYAGMQGLVTRDQFVDILDQTLAANRHLTAADDDVWANFQVTPGVSLPMPVQVAVDGPPTLLCYTTALPHQTCARYYRDGRPAVTSVFRSPPPQSFEQRVKNRSRFPHFMSHQHARGIDPDAFGLMLDTDGFIAEGTGANVFFVMDGVVYTPKTRNILVGVSRQHTIALAQELGFRVVEDDLTHYEAYNADEAFWTASSTCILPMSRIDGRPVGTTCPGPVTVRLLDAWSRAVGVDIVAQARRFAPAEDG